MREKHSWSLILESERLSERPARSCESPELAGRRQTDRQRERERDVKGWYINVMMFLAFNDFPRSKR